MFGLLSGLLTNGTLVWKGDLAWVSYLGEYPQLLLWYTTIWVLQNVFRECMKTQYFLFMWCLYDYVCILYILLKDLGFLLYSGYG